MRAEALQRSADNDKEKEEMERQNKMVHKEEQHQLQCMWIFRGRKITWREAVSAEHVSN